MEDRKRAIALGFFDGVHRGHGALLELAARRAEEKGLRLSAITFDTGAGGMPGKDGAPLITTPAERAGLMHRLYGVEDVIIEPFDHRIRHMSWRDYVTKVLIEKYGAAHVVAGYDFRFGYRGEGDQERLRLLCIEEDIGCDIVPQIRLNGIPVSSTHIRDLLARGDMEQATAFLGHPFCLTDQVRHGNGLGSRLGFPTLNLQLPEGCVQPPYGVYAAQAWIGERVFPAVVNFGRCPTVRDSGETTVEAFLLDFQGDLYGQAVRLEFMKFLREEQRFPDTESLQKQVRKDIEEAREYFG